LYGARSSTVSRAGPSNSTLLVPRIGTSVQPRLRIITFQLYIGLEKIPFHADTVGLANPTACEAALMHEFPFELTDLRPHAVVLYEDYTILLNRDGGRSI
jgi:hypothetical protein